MSIAPPETLSSPLLDSAQPDAAQIHTETPTLPPTNLNSNEPPLESSLHLRQIILLLPV